MEEVNVCAISQLCFMSSCLIPPSNGASLIGLSLDYDWLLIRVIVIGSRGCGGCVGTNEAGWGLSPCQ